MDVRQESVADLDAYAGVSIAFDVVEVLDVVVQQDGLGGLGLARRRVDVPYVKDYDTLDGGPKSWPDRFDLSNWVLLSAHVSGRRVGGAAIAFGADVPMVEEIGVALLWDIRISPSRLILAGFRAEYEERRRAEEESVRAALADPSVVIAHVVYSTG